MMRLLLVVALLAPACAPKRVAWSDPSLPEASEEVVVVTPVDVLIAGAASEEPSARGRSLHLLISAAPTADAEGYATRALWDPDAWVQSQAVEALAHRLDEPAAVTLLEGFVRRGDGLADPYVRGAAAARLAQAGHLQTRDALSSAWKAEKAAWRAAPLQLGAFALGDAQALEPLAKAIEAGDISLETGFLLDVGRTGDPRLKTALSVGEDWIEEEVVLAYATARMLVGDTAGAKPLEQALNGDDDLAALEALDYLANQPSDSATALIKKARSGGSDLARSYAELALAGRGEGSAERFVEAMLDESPEVRALAVQFAVAAAHVDGAPRRNARVAKKVLETALTDESIEVRLAALKGAAKSGVLVSETPVKVHLADELMAVRIEAAAAMLARKS